MSKPDPHRTRTRPCSSLRSSTGFNRLGSTSTRDVASDCGEKPGSSHSPSARLNRLWARALAAAATATLALSAPVVLATPAAAHVTVTPGSAQAGGYATLAFKVPTERDDADTTKLEVEFPADHPFPSVSTQPKAGWEVQIEQAELDEPIDNHGEQVTERIARITWTAAEESAQIGPGEFDTFPISVGPLPTDTDRLVFKAIQTYSGGEVVRWIEEAAEGSDVEPELPAPVLELSPAESADTGAEADEAAADGDEAEDGVSGSAAQEGPGAEDSASAEAELTGNTAASGDELPTTNQVNTAIGLAIGAVVLALIGAGLGGAALASRGNAQAAAPVTPPGPPPAY